MTTFLSDIVLAGANDIQFKNTSGTNTGKIESDGDNLVLSNAVGDILLGDGASDVYIGDGTNNVDILFEQSGSIKAEDGSSGVTLTLGSGDTTLALGSSISSAATVLGALTVGVDDTGHDVTFFGATSGKKMVWDQSADTLIVDGTLDVNGDATVLSGAGSGSLTVGRNANENMVIYVDDSNTTITGVQDSDSNASHSFILNRTFLGSGANNFIIQKDGTAQLTLDTSGNASILGNLTLGDGGDKTITGPLNNDLILNARPNGSDEGLKIQIGGTDKLSVLQDGGTTFAGNVTAGSNSLTAGSLDINGNADISGNLTGVDTLTATTLSVTNYGLASGDIPNNAANTTGVAYGLNGAAGSLLTAPAQDQLLYTGQISNGVSGLFAASDNSNSVITLNRHSGNYDSQLGFSSNGSVYYRKFSNSAINTTQDWKTMAFTDSDISGNAATVTNGVYTTGDQTIGGNKTFSNNLTVNGTTILDSLQLEATGDYITFYGGNSTQHSITSRQLAGGTGDDLRFNTYGSYIINLDSNNNQSSAANSSFYITRHGGADGDASGNVLFDIDGENGDATFTGTIGSGAITSTGKIQGTELEGTSLDINGDADISSTLLLSSTNYNEHLKMRRGSYGYDTIITGTRIDLQPTSATDTFKFIADLQTTGVLTGASLDINGNADISGDLTGVDTLTATTLSVTNYGLASSDIPNNAADTTGLAANATNLNASDDRDMAPEDYGYANDLRIFFSTKEGLEAGSGTGTNYQDVLYLNSYTDASGGDANVLAFDKSEKKIYHYQADQAATNWGTAKQLAYTDSDISGDTTGNAATATLSSTTTVTDHSTNNIDYPVVWHNNANALYDTASKFTFNPSTGALTTTTLSATNYGLASGDIPNNAADTSGSAATLTEPRAINGVDFDGSAAITVTAAATTLTGTSLNSTVVGSSLTSVGEISSGSWRGTAIAGAYIADNTINSQHYADGSIDTAHIADDQVTFAKAQGVTPNVYGNIIKLLPSDFVANDDAGTSKVGIAYKAIAGSSYGMKPNAADTELFALVSIPQGMSATHVDVFAKTNLGVIVYEAQTNANTMVSKGTGNCNTQINITDVSSTATNFLAIQVTTTATSDRVFGGQITIA